MNGFSFPTVETAPVAARETLAAVNKNFGFVPNLLSGLANSPVALHTYLGLAEQFGKTSLSPAEQQAVSISTSTENRCDYCVAAHSVLAGKSLSPSQISALRSGTPTGNSRLDAVATFTRAVVNQRGFISEDQLAAFFGAGFNRAQVLEVLVGISQKTLSNYANHLLGTPLDAAFESARWQPAEDRAA
ncbi:MAG: hypothetical protein A3E01_14865 [Gammaproteobacteria bacterium RIFCSPHIGHO2_12_FULL_63_22]|nr:MAG: hypothetical protein A3E01_14865 [Gammaproteobacteria bacterium RIFCSPHIGHO2_12_FULL_63_22]